MSPEEERMQLNTEITRLHEECVKYRTALNRIAHPTTNNINEGFDKEIANRALFIGAEIEPLPPGALKPFSYKTII